MHYLFAGLHFLQASIFGLHVLFFTANVVLANIMALALPSYRVQFTLLLRGFYVSRMKFRSASPLQMFEFIVFHRRHRVNVHGDLPKESC